MILCEVVLGAPGESGVSKNMYSERLNCVVMDFEKCQYARWLCHLWQAIDMWHLQSTGPAQKGGGVGGQGIQADYGHTVRATEYLKQSNQVTGGTWTLFVTR